VREEEEWWDGLELEACDEHAGLERGVPRLEPLLYPELLLRPCPLMCFELPLLPWAERMPVEYS
jgi:hypothetical protein